MELDTWKGHSSTVVHAFGVLLSRGLRGYSACQKTPLLVPSLRDSRASWTSYLVRPPFGLRRRRASQCMREADSRTLFSRGLLFAANLHGFDYGVAAHGK
jgi:hypothetical protein